DGSATKSFPRPALKSAATVGWTSVLAGLSNIRFDILNSHYRALGDPNVPIHPASIAAHAAHGVGRAHCYFCDGADGTRQPLLQPAPASAGNRSQSGSEIRL